MIINVLPRSVMATNGPSC